MSVSFAVVGKLVGGIDGVKVFGREGAKVGDREADKFGSVDVALFELFAFAVELVGEGG